MGRKGDPQEELKKRLRQKSEAKTKGKLDGPRSIRRAIDAMTALEAGQLHAGLAAVTGETELQPVRPLHTKSEVFQCTHG